MHLPLLPKFVMPKATLHVLSARHQQRKSSILPPKSPVKAVKQLGSSQAITPHASQKHISKIPNNTFELSEEILRDDAQLSNSEEMIQMDLFELFL